MYDIIHITTNKSKLATIARHIELTQTEDHITGNTTVLSLLSFHNETFIELTSYKKT